MAAKKFSKGEAIRFGWNTMKNNLGFFIGLLIVVGLIYVIHGVIIELTEKKGLVLSIIIDIAFWVLQSVIGMGLIRIALRFCDNEKGKFTELFSCFPLFFKYLVGAILYGLTVLAGTILLIVPGIIWAIRFQFFNYFIVDKNLGPIESLKRSYLITKDSRWNLFLFWLLLLGINLLGALALLIGLFATIPTAMVAIAFVYRKLLTQTESAETTETLQKETDKPVKKIFITTAIVTILLLFGLWTIWKDELPPQDDDLQITRIEIPEKENAYYYFKLAAEKVYWPEDRKQFIRDMAYGEKWDSAFADELIKKNKETFYHIEEALRCSSSQFPEPLLDVEFKAGRLIEIAGLGSIKADYLFRQGKEQEAFDELIKIIKLGHMVEDLGGIITYAVGNVVKGVGPKKFQMMVKNTNLQPEILTGYIKELGQFSEKEEILTNVFKSEYKFVSDFLEGKYLNHSFLGISNEESDKYSKFLNKSSLIYKPNKTKRILAETYRGIIENIPKPCNEIERFKRPQRNFITYIKWALSGNILGEFIHSFSPKSVEILPSKCYRNFDLIGTQLLIAMKSYKAKTGKLPQSLDELVPEYFPEVPGDPFDGKPIRYFVEKKIIYSVGLDSKNIDGTDERFTIKIEF